MISKAFLYLGIAIVAPTYGADFEKISVSPPPDLQRADIHVWRRVKKPEAVLVLIPGTNGNGEKYLKNPEWQRFASDHNLGLVGVSFASEMPVIEEGRGYYYPQQGSGEALLKCLKKAYGKEMPLVMYGFSAGAYFTSRFVEWRPDTVITWCAYSAGEWEEPEKDGKIRPPGIVACGELDRWLGSSLIFFKQGRAAGRLWLWVSVAETGHASNAKLDAFVRSYFATILTGQDRGGLWVDIDRLTSVDPATENPALTGWLPDSALLNPWKEIHKP